MRGLDRVVVHEEDYAEIITSRAGSGSASRWKGNCHLSNSESRQSCQQRTVNMGLNNDAPQQTPDLKIGHQLLIFHHLPSHKVLHRLVHCQNDDDQQTPSTNSSRTNWTSPLSPSSGDIKSDLFDTRIGSNRSCRELTHQVPV